MTAKKDYKTINLPPKYQPKKTEEYMSVEQKAFFYQLLIAEKKDLEQVLVDSSDDVNLGQRLDSVGAMDEGDAATLSIEADMNIKIQERNKNILLQVENALSRLEDGSYGYSVISGEEIGLKRLLSRPTATMTAEEKDEMEK